MRVKQIGPVELNELLARESILLLDVREPHEAAYCQIEGSVNLPLRSIKHADAHFDKKAPVVVYCHHGPRSMMAAQALLALGFEDVTNLAGGIDRWSALVDPNVPRY